MIIDFSLLGIAIAIQIWLLMLSLQRRDDVNLRLVIYLPAYLLITSATLIALLLVNRSWFFIIKSWLAVGENSIIALLCLDIMYSLLLKSRVVVGITFQIGAYLSIAAFGLWWEFPRITSVACNYFALVSAIALFACCAYAPLGKGDIYRWIGLAMPSLSGLQSLCAIIKRYQGMSIGLSRFQQTCWIFGLLGLAMAVKRFPSNGTLLTRSELNEL